MDVMWFGMVEVLMEVWNDETVELRKEDHCIYSGPLQGNLLTWRHKILGKMRWQRTKWSVPNSAKPMPIKALDRDSRIAQRLADSLNCQ